MLSVSFSICLPLYNGRQLLGETLESVRLQTHTDWELIVVEDASPEPSRDLVEAFATRVEQPVTYHVNPANLNCARSRDEAFRHAAHDFFAPLDQDDIWKPHHLAELARVFTATDPDFVFTSCVTFREDPTQIEADFTPAPTVRNRLRSAYFFCQYWLQPSCVAFHRRLLARIGPWSKNLALKPATFPGNRDMGEDRNFFLRAFHAGVEPAWTGCVTTCYRQHDSSMMGRDSFALVHRAWIHNQYGTMSGLPLAGQRRYLAQTNANAGRQLNATPQHRRLAAAFYFRGWRWYPLRIDRLVFALGSFLGLKTSAGPST